jgi:P pilus assembly chaperone PapD
MKAIRITALALPALIAALAPTSSYAMRVTPIQLEMTSAGTASRGAVTVTNNSSEPLPLEVSVQHMTQDEDGNRKLSAGGESEFLLLPPQALIPPGATQVFRVQWLGEPLLAESQSFILYITQVPVKLPAGKNAAVQVVVSMGCMINVAPPQSIPDLKIAAVGIETDNKGKRRPFVTVQNPTRVHALLPQSRLRLSGGGWSKELTASDLSEKVGIGLVQPGKRRKFVLPVDVPDRVTSIQALIEFKPVRP